jgi:serine/threonine-protein kinase
MPLWVDQTFAGYTVVRRLGAGGMGEVYLVRHPRLPRRDALKLLTGDVSADPSLRERFLREADLASTLWHPHIVGVHDRGEHEGQLWISMDFVNGEDAGSLIAQRYPAGMPQELATAIIAAVASALDYAHKQGLLHRDVKPANILLTHGDDEGEQRILLTDFGIARTVDDYSGLTDTNMTVGTVDYAAPEQLMGEEMDGRADQYSLAATAYHLLTGAPPFRDSNAAVIIGRHLNTEPPALANTRPELAPLDHVLAAALAKDPNDRFATCSDFAGALSQQASGNAGASAPAAPTTPAPVKRPRTASPHAPKSEQGESASPLSPGWYPDPNSNGGTLYWDGRGWRTAPLPRAGEPVGGAVANASGGRSRPLLVVASIAIALAVVIVGALLFVQNQDTGPSEPATSSSAFPTEPTFPTAPRPRSTSSAVPSPTSSALPRTTVALPPIPVPRPRGVPYWNAVIVGTCDEGGSCGVKQREAPYVDAERLHPNDLKDGVTVSVVCQTTGDLRSSEGSGSSYVWYRLINGAYVNSVYTSIGAASAIPPC